MSKEKSFGGLIDKIELMTTNREIDRQTWLSEVFPEWGTFLNEEIENTVVKPNAFALWWFGACSFFLKTPKNANLLIDNYSGPSIAATWERHKWAGVMKQTGAKSQVWLRLNPHVVDPFAFKEVDALVSTHDHLDHCDIYTIKPLIKNTDCKFIGPPKSCLKFVEYGVPKERIVEVNVGDSYKIKDIEIVATESADKTVLFEVDDPAKEFNKATLNYVFKTSAGNIYDAGDSHYSNMFFKHGKEFDIDLALVAFGDNPDGMTDKMTSYDCFRVAKALKTKVLIPVHYDNWSTVQGDPLEVERIVREKAPWIKTVIMQWGGKFEYPTDSDMGRYKYPKHEDKFRPELSWEYGKERKIIY